MALHICLQTVSVFLVESKPLILQDVRHQLHDEAEDQRLYKLAQKQLKQIEKQQQQGQAVLPLLENSLIDLACDDPGSVIGPQIILPTLKKRLLARAQHFHHATMVRDHMQVIVVKCTGAIMLHAPLCVSLHDTIVLPQPVTSCTSVRCRVQHGPNPISTVLLHACLGRCCLCGQAIVPAERHAAEGCISACQPRAAR